MQKYCAVQISWKKMFIESLIQAKPTYNPLAKGLTCKSQQEMYVDTTYNLLTTLSWKIKCNCIRRQNSKYGLSQQESITNHCFSHKKTPIKIHQWDQQCGVTWLKEKWLYASTTLPLHVTRQKGANQVLARLSTVCLFPKPWRKKKIKSQKRLKKTQEK